jgi:membrane-bound ClpP family serine protease
MSVALLGHQAFLAATGAATGTTNDAYLVAALVLGGIALLLLCLEVFIPSGGILSLLCGACAVASVVAMFMWSTTAGIVLLLVYTIAAPVLALLILKVWAHSPIARRYMLADEAKPVGSDAPNEELDPEDPDAAQSAADLVRSRRFESLAKLVGTRGVTETPLRPSGFVRLECPDGPRRVDASAESGLVEAGVPVRVVAVVDGTLRVRADG